jgi:hypothetical protein
MSTNTQWNTVEGTWDGNSFKWDEITLVTELVSEGASVPEILGLVQDFKPEKRRRFIKLVCKVKGIETYSGQKTIRDDIEISADDVKLVVKKVLGIDLTVENIHV